MGAYLKLLESEGKAAERCAAAEERLENQRKALEELRAKHSEILSELNKVRAEIVGRYALPYVLRGLPVPEPDELIWGPNTDVNEHRALFGLSILSPLPEKNRFDEGAEPIPSSKRRRKTAKTKRPDLTPTMPPESDAAEAASATAVDAVEKPEGKTKAKPEPEGPNVSLPFEEDLFAISEEQVPSGEQAPSEKWMPAEEQAPEERKTDTSGDSAPWESDGMSEASPEELWTAEPLTEAEGAGVPSWLSDEPAAPIEDTAEREPEEELGENPFNAPEQLAETGDSESTVDDELPPWM